jgi:hypothetical protein
MVRYNKNRRVEEFAAATRLIQMAKVRAFLATPPGATDLF